LKGKVIALFDYGGIRWDRLGKMKKILSLHS